MPEQVNLLESGPAHDASGASARLALLLSAAVCPGAGHFAQRRWIMGALYLTVFVACLVMTILAVVVPLIVNLHITMDFAEKGSSEAYRVISPVKLLIWFVLTILVYVAALLDIIVYAHRQARRRLGECRKNLEQKD